MQPNVAILCSGPSLRRFLDRPPRRDAHDIVIGVNRGACAFPCDWWAFNDAQTFDNNRCQGRPRCFTGDQAFAQIRDKRLADRFDWTLYSQIDTSCPADPGWTSFSLTVAMVLAEWLLMKRGIQGARDPGIGGGAVTLYGVDQVGENDWDGPSPVPVIRTEERWQRELHHFGHVLAWLRSRGVDVARDGTATAAVA